MKSLRLFVSAQWPKGLMLLAFLAVIGCARDEDEQPITNVGNEVAQFTAEVPLAFNELFLDLERFAEGYRPPVSARTSAYLGLAAYEAAQPGMSGEYSSLSGYYPGLEVPDIVPGEDYHWPLVLVATYERALELFFPTAPAEQLFRIYQTRGDFFQRYRQEVPTAIFSRSVARGKEVAEAVYAWSETDQIGHQAYLRNTDPNYVPPSGPGLWQPTFPDFSSALLPYWGQVRTFAADGGDITPPPLAYNESPSSEIYQQAREVVDRTAIARVSPDSEERWIADFWSDDCPILTFTPSGRWIAVLNQVVELEGKRLHRALEAYLLVGIALSDSGVRCWHEKYRHSYERPIDYIRRVMGDSDWNTVMCPDGSGLFFTPNFPAYPSGHATFGAAAAEVMAALFGDDYGMTDRCHEGRTEFNGTPRTFSSFYQMAEENAESRIPLGVHFRMDADSGLELGYGIGRKVMQLPLRR